MATRKRRQKQTLKEFKAWLQGVEELQPEDWSPNPDQWKLIRDKINGIIEEKRVVEKVVNVANAGGQPHPVYPVYPGQPPMIAPPPPVGGLPIDADVDISPAAKQLLNPAANGGKVVTPNIDTSDGNVNSPFA